VKSAGARALLVAGIGFGVVLGGCGAADERTATTASAPRTTQTATTTVSPGNRGPIPAALRTAESDAEDTIDLALAGNRARAVEKAHDLRAVADGAAARALRSAGVSGGEIAEFRVRARTVARLAPSAGLLDVALASNRAFELMSGFFARYDSPIPPTVTALDHLDYEAKLEARAGNVAAIGSAVKELGRTWASLRPDVIKAGGEHVAARFDAHVARLERLAARGGPAVAREAQRGLDLVDEIEAVYRR
jgi:hypothetical protein